MSFWKHAKLLGPLLSVAIVGACIGSSLTGYELPKYEIEAHAAQVEEEEPAASDDNIMAVGNWELDDGVYRGTGIGYSGEVTVDVTIADKTITQIDIVSESDDDAFFNRAKGVIDSIISTQSLEVDVVSGATYSSRGIINAVKNALTGEVDTSETAESEPQGSTEVAEVEDASAYKDGTYYGTGIGFGGELSVKVVISDGKIASIEVVSNKDDAAYFNRAKALLATIVEKQSTNVDTVSGATYSSVGLITAVRNALSQAAISGTNENTSDIVLPSASGSSGVGAGSTTVSKVEEASAYKDGTYYGTGIGFGGEMTLKVVVSGGKIASIEVVSDKDDADYFDRAKVLLGTIVSAQTTNVDTVSGATYSSVGIINAVRDALSQAAVNPSDADKEPIAVPPNTNTDPGKIEVDTGDDSAYEDGTYTGTAICYPDEDEDFDEYTLSLSVTIKAGKIVSIEDIKQIDGTGIKTNVRYIGMASEKISDAVLAAGELSSVDAVSGATCSSKAIVEAIVNALKIANGEITPDDVTDDTTSDMEDENGKDDSSENEGDENGKDDSSENERDDSSLEDAEEGVIYHNGTFAGSARCVDTEDDGFDYMLGLKILIANDEIVGITDVTEDGVDYLDSENGDYIDYALNGRIRRGTTYVGLWERIMDLKTISNLTPFNRNTLSLVEDDKTINAVSGATYSSESIYEAVLDALNQAKITEND